MTPERLQEIKALVKGKHKKADFYELARELGTEVERRGELVKWGFKEGICDLSPIGNARAILEHHWRNSVTKRLLAGQDFDAAMAEVEAATGNEA